MKEGNELPGSGMQRRPICSAAVVALVLALSAAGCGRSTIVDRARTNYIPGDMSAEMDFWYTLPGRAAVSNDEGLHGLMLLEDANVRVWNYQERVAHAQARGWLPTDWDEAPELAMRRGTLASAIAVITGMRGGVMMRLTGPIPRYALREVVYAGIMPPSSENQTISGDDFIAVITRADDYILLKQARGRAPAPAGPANELGN